MRYLIILSLLFTQTTYANDAAGTAATVLLLFGAARGAEHSIYSGRWPDEIGDWKNPNTQITAEIVEQCNFLIEGRLLSSNRYNIMMLITKNLDKEVKIKPQDVEFEFESGVVRRGDVDLDTEYTVKKDGKYIILIPFPRKDDFLNQNKLTVSMPFTSDSKACNAKLVFNRPKDVPPLISTSTRMTSVEAELSLGFISSTGNLKDIVGSSNSTVRLDVNFIGSRRHGMYLGLGSNGENDLSQQEGTSLGFTANSTKASFSSWNIGYMYRTILTRRSFMHYKLGADFSSLLLVDNDNRNTRASYRGTGAHAQVMYHHTLAQVDRGFWRGDYAVSVGGDGRQIFSGDIKGDRNFKGTQASFLTSISIGF